MARGRRERSDRDVAVAAYVWRWIDDAYNSRKQTYEEIARALGLGRQAPGNIHRELRGLGPLAIQGLAAAAHGGSLDALVAAAMAQYARHGLNGLNAAARARLTGDDNQLEPTEEVARLRAELRSEKTRTAELARWISDAREYLLEAPHSLHLRSMELLGVDSHQRGVTAAASIAKSLPHRSLDETANRFDRSSSSERPTGKKLRRP